MTSSDDAEQALRIAISELWSAADRPCIRERLKAAIDAAKDRVADAKDLAQVAVDEMVLSTSGRVRPVLGMP